MRRLTLQELDGRWATVEAAIDATPGIDPWCSGPDWVVPVTTAFAPRQQRLLLVADDEAGGDPDGFALLGRFRSGRRTPMYGGLEPLWGFGSPLFGRHLDALVGRLAAHLSDREDWRILFLPGMPASNVGETTVPGPLTVTVAEGLATLGSVRFGEGITRRVADLDPVTGGYEGWLGRRSGKFRRNLRRTARHATEAGVVIRDVSAEPDLFERLLAIERRSWKGRERSGITAADMGAMYRSMIDRLRVRRRLLAHVALLDGTDVGYILGGLRARRYRGLQLSYVDGIDAHSVGNLLQDHQLRLLGCAGAADTYDLGMDFDYKRRWADRPEPSMTVIVDRRRQRVASWP